MKRVAETIKASIREIDEVGRYGGEEFLILVDTDDLDVATTIAERVQRNVEQLEWEIEGLKTTVSIGLVYSNEKMGEQLGAEADLRLYELESSGRNKVTASHINGFSFFYSDGITLTNKNQQQINLVFVVKVHCL